MIPSTSRIASAATSSSSRLSGIASQWRNQALCKTMLGSCCMQQTRQASPQMMRLLLTKSDCGGVFLRPRHGMDGVGMGGPSTFLRGFSSSSSSSSESGDSVFSSLDTISLEPPHELDSDMADTIAQTVDLFLTKGGSSQRLMALSQLERVSVVEKWQKMMEIYFTTQLQVIANLGYPPDQHGLQMYAFHIHQLMQNLRSTSDNDDVLYLHLLHQKRNSWRKCVALAFQLNLSQIPTLDIVQARDQMHQVTSKMTSAEILMEIQKRVQKISNPDENTEHILKHNALQDIIIHQVYLGKDELLVKLGYPPGPTGYATFQIAISDFEEDPLIRDYTQAAMERVWNSAGMDFREIMSAGATPRHTP